MIRSVLTLFAIMLLAIAMFAIIVWHHSVRPAVQKIDCTWSEISPDFSLEMKQEIGRAHV